MSNPIKAVIFDKDGTLHDTEKLFHIAWKLAAEELNVPDIDATVRACTGRALSGIAVYWADKYPDIPFEDYLPRRQKHFHAMVSKDVPVKDGAMELLAYLKEHGYKVALATSSPYDEAVDHLKRTDMYPYFDAVVGGDMIKNGKPAPDIYLLAAEKLGVAPENCVGVEDSINGILSIHAAGMRPVMVPDLIEPTPEIEKLLWAKCDVLTDIIAELEKEVSAEI